jgi:hypothetical protein
MSLKNLILTLVLASATTLAWLGFSAAPAAAAAPTSVPTQLNKLDKEIGFHAVKKHKKHKKGKHHKGNGLHKGKGNHKKAKA